MALAVGCYAGSLGSHFVLDDFYAVRNPVVMGDLPWAALLDHDFWGNPAPGVVSAYRPLAVLTLRLNWLLGHGSAPAFHAVNVALHAAAVALAYRLFAPLAGERAALLGAALFAVFAAPSEAVEAIVGRADLLVTLAALGGAWAHLREGPGGAAAAAGLYLAGMASKETGLLLPAAWVALDWLARGRAPAPRRLAAYAATAAGFLLARQALFGSLLVHTFDAAENPLVEAAPLARLLGASKVFLTRYALGVLDPGRRLYSCTAYACGPGAAGDPWAWAGLALAGVLVASPLLLRRRAPAAAAGLAWFALLFLPVSNFLVMAPTIYGERLLYAPGVGLALALGVGCEALARRLARPGLVYGAWAGLLGVNALAVQGQNQAWHDEEALYLSGLEYGAEGEKVQANMAEIAYRHLDWPAMERYARRATELWAYDWRPHAKLGLALDHLGRTDEANDQFKTAYALAARPLPAQLRVLHAKFLARHGQLADARRVLDAGPPAPEVEELRRALGEGAAPR